MRPWKKIKAALFSYEFQVLASNQGGGIGKKLVQYLSDVGAGWQMEKIVLTVFKGVSFVISSGSLQANKVGLAANVDAIRFYQKLG